MFDNTAHQDYLKTEMEYRLGRIRSDIAGRRRRRSLARRSNGDWPGDTGDTTTTWAS
ncbi:MULTISPECIES: hypothetical protein [unclassified Nocardioides]|uniref:hypothetical protein n=1 Tax=unclassified Nocardioides TaxID=2615069 RepID=UPI00360C4262